jgi:hypothetical protein
MKSDRMLYPDASVLLLSSTLLTDRMLRYTDAIGSISREMKTCVWSNPLHALHPASNETTQSRIEPFPTVIPGKFRNQLLRRVADYAWDSKQLSASRNSFWENRRRALAPAYLRLLHSVGGRLAQLGMQSAADSLVETVLLGERRSLESERRLRTLRPAVVVTTSPFRTNEPGIVASARRLRIPVLAFITSWDNLSTKGRLGLKYDGYLVWSEQMKKELYKFYPQATKVPVITVGAPQFDVFFQDRFNQSRADFCGENNLKPTRPIIVYGLGSPNLLREHFGAVQFAKRVVAGELGDVQLLVRPHPLFHAAPELNELATLGTQVVVQACDRTVQNSVGGMQDEYQIRQWVNTFRHANVVINLSSTITIDAALCDTPVVNLDYDPEPGQPNRQLVHDINHVWDHFRPIAESSGVCLARNPDEVIAATREYLARPALHREGRRAIAAYVCGFLDGQCGARFGNAILSFCRDLSESDRRLA